MEVQKQNMQDVIQQNKSYSIQMNEILERAIYRAENQTNLLNTQVNNILDEVGDILHDDLLIKKLIINRILINPAFREIIARELLIVIKSRHTG